jgi:uncharacterized coiled-coil protein SlyX
MSITAGFGQRQQHTNWLAATANWRAFDVSIRERLVGLTAFITGRALLAVGAVAVALMSAALPVVIGYVENSMLAPHPTITTAPTPSPVGEQRHDNTTQTPIDFNVAHQEAINLLAVQDLVVSQQAELRRLSSQVAVLTAKLRTMERAAASAPKPWIAPPWGSPRSAPPKSH